MGDAVHCAVGFRFGGEIVVACDEIFGKAGFPGKGSGLMFGLLEREGPVHRSQIEPVVGPAEEFLRIGIDELGEKDPVKGRILADEDRFFSTNPKTGKRVDNVLGDVARRPAGGNLRPSKSIHSKTLLVAFFPRFDRLHDDCLVFVDELTTGKIDNFVSDFEDFMNLRVEPICLSI